MGWIPEVTATSLEDIRVVKLADAAPKTVYSHGPQAVRDPVSNRTYAAFLGEDRDLYITYYDHEDGSVATKVLVDTRLIAVDDTHAAPSLTVNVDGHLHIVWGSHNSQHRHLRSDNPHDISAWTGQTLTGDGTYPHIVADRSNGDLYIFDRPGDGSSHSSPFPSHAYGSVRKSTDGGVTWSAASAIIDATGVPESAVDVYIGGVREADDNRFHIAWLLARGSTHDDVRQDVYHAIYDPSDGNLYTIDGTNLGSTITFAEHADSLVADVQDNHRTALTLDGDRVYISWGFREVASDQSAQVAIWDGTTWTTQDTGILQDLNYATFQVVYPIKGALRLLIGEAIAGGDDLALYGAPTDGEHWHPLEAQVIESVEGEGFDRVNLVPGRGESVAITQELPDGAGDTNATASDLLPLYLILDPAHAVYQGTIAGHDHDADYAAAAHTHTEDTIWMPLTTVDTAGDPVLVWDDDDSLIPTEVPI